MTHIVQMPRGAVLALLVAVSAVLAVLAVSVWAAGIQEIRFGTVTAGGGTSSGGALELKGTVGQVAVGSSSGGTLSIDGGSAQVARGLVSAVPGTGSSVPSASMLHDPHPNPFNPMTNVSFELAARGEVRVRIFDPRGQLVRSLVQGEWPAGRHLVPWDGRTDQGATAPSGIYFLLFESAGVSDTKKMTLLK